MEIKIYCSKCKKELLVKDIFQDTLQNIIIQIESCNNMDCYDCSKCEEITIAETKIKQLKKSLDNIRRIINDKTN